MRRLCFRVLVFVCVVVALSAAQVQTGIPQFSSLGGGPFDVINLGNLNVHFAVPIVHKAGRGLPLTYDITYDSSVWYPATTGSSTGWQPIANFGWSTDAPSFSGYMSYDSNVDYCQGRNGFQGSIYTYFNYAYQDRSAVSHSFFGSASYNECTHVQRDLNASRGGYTLTAYGDSGSFQLVGVSGEEIWPALAPDDTSGSITDSNGNQITMSSGVITDTLNTTALRITNGWPNKTYTYKAPSGNDVSPPITAHYTSLTVQTSFGCLDSYGAQIGEYGPTSVSLVDAINLPDGTSYQFTYEPNTDYSGTYTGRIASVTLPTGGQLQYSYSGGNNGIRCADGSAAGLTRTTPDGSWQYSRSGMATTVTDPQSNQTVISFQDIYETQRQVFQGSSTSGRLLKTVTTCYNGNLTNCTGTAVTTPITRRTVTTQLPGMAGQSKTDTYYSSDLGVVTEQDEYDFGASTPTRKTLITYALWDRPSLVKVTDGAGNIKAQTAISYDQTAVTATTGTPQHQSVSGSRGNPTTISRLVQGSSNLTQTFTYFDTGNVKSATDVNGAVTDYTYGACVNSLPTQVSLPLSLSWSMAWNCTGGVVTSATDENNQTTSTTYNDPYFWRPAATADQASNVTNITYPSATVMNSSLSFNGGNSVVEGRLTADSLGRPRVGQKRQAPGATNYDSVETDYDSLGRPSRTTMPYSGTAGQTNGSAPATNLTYDALGRPTQTTDAGGGTASFSYSNNDVYVTVGEAGSPPTGEHDKRRQLQYDALGRLISVCEVTAATGSASCGQNASATGFLTTYTYDVLDNLVSASQNAQATAQTRSYAYDGLGRMTSETNPESGTTYYTYDSDSTCSTYQGDLVKRIDAVGNVTCYAYDALHRVTAITYPSGSYASATPEKHYVYDSATVNGNTMANAAGRLARAYTGSSATTDLGFNYTARGEIADVYEKTPNSGTYYNAHQTYWASGAPYQLSGISGIPTITYGADGEGRPNTVNASSGQNPITSVTYNTASLPTAITFGSSDSDSFSFDSNTFRMSQYQFAVNGSSDTGTLTWNSNGSLASLAISDALNSSNSQTCGYSHDDLSRIASVSCESTWGQNFSFDPFGNISKDGSISFAGSYSTSTNRLTNMSSSYDSNGNLTGISSDATYSYSWDSEGKPVSITRSGSTVDLTYDALGRMVEQNRGGSYTQVVYGPYGSKLALMNGSTLQKAFVPLPAGAQAVYNASGLAYYKHADWLGSSRLASTPSRTLYYDGAYAPYGESYSEMGTTDRDFTGQNQDTHPGLYDFMYREYHPVSGRWNSPDPAGLAAVDLTNPQSLNRYAYVMNNPTNFIDPLGLSCLFYIQKMELGADDHWHPAGVEGYLCNSSTLKRIFGLTDQVNGPGGDKGPQLIPSHQPTPPPACSGVNKQFVSDMNALNAKYATGWKEAALAGVVLNAAAQPDLWGMANRISQANAKILGFVGLIGPTVLHTGVAIVTEEGQQRRALGSAYAQSMQQCDPTR